MTENKRYEIVFLNGLDGLCSIQDTEAEISIFYNDLGYINHIKPVCDLLNEQEEEIKNFKLENQLLLEEIKDIRDKLTIYLKIKGVDIDD